MIDRKSLKSIMRELKTTLNLEDDIKLELRPMKTKAASTSLRRKIIRLNKKPNPEHQPPNYKIPNPPRADSYKTQHNPSHQRLL